MDRTRKEVSLAEEETPINIESPLNSTYIEPKKEELKQIEETKPKRERKKKKKEVKKIERPTLYTYTVTGCVKNSQGRFRFTDIIEAQDESLASDIFKQRAKKEFSAVRAINKIEVNKFKEGDVKYTEEIIEELKSSESKQKVSYSDEELTNLILGTVLTMNNSKIYAVVYNPSKKKSALRKTPKLYYMAENVEEAKKLLKDEVIIQLGEFNEKWIHSISPIENNFSKEVVGTNIFKSLLRRVKKLTDESKEVLKDFYFKTNTLEANILEAEDREELAKVLLEIPKIILEQDGDTILEKRIEELKIGRHIKSAEIELTKEGLVINDTGHTDSILGKKYALQVEKDDNKFTLIKPVIPILMNQNMFKTYTVNSIRNGVQTLVENCNVMAESEDKAADYVVFVCKKEELIKQNDTIKTDVFLDKKHVASFICKV